MIRQRVEDLAFKGKSRGMDKSEKIAKAFREKCMCVCIYTHCHIFASVSGEGLFVLQKDAVTRFPTCIAGGFANTAFGLCKKKRKIVSHE